MQSVWRVALAPRASARRLPGFAERMTEVLGGELGPGVNEDAFALGAEDVVAGERAVGVDAPALDALDPRLELHLAIERCRAAVLHLERAGHAGVTRLDVRDAEHLVERQRDDAAVYEAR